jgi:xanthine dehydrogenase YagR molybdenum-binding subunit
MRHAPLGPFYWGCILNAKTARSQFRGGMIMRLGLALTGETMLDPRAGRIMNPSLAGYHVTGHLDVPEIDVIWTGIPDPHTPMGAHGIGEIGITGGRRGGRQRHLQCNGQARSRPSRHA